MNCIYRITNRINGKIYIGKTTTSLDKRFKEHKNEALKWKACGGNIKKFGYSSKLYPAMIKYGIENFNITLIEQLADDVDINEAEKHYIKKYDALNDTIGYNISPGGLGGPLFLGHHHSQETKDKISKKGSGKKQDPEFAKRRCIKHRKLYQNLSTLEVFNGVDKIREKYPQIACIATCCYKHRKSYGYYWINLNTQHMNTPLSREEADLLIKKYDNEYLERKLTGRSKWKVSIKAFKDALSEEEKKIRMQQAIEKAKQTKANRTPEEQAIVHQNLQRQSINNFKALLSRIDREEFIEDYTIKRLDRAEMYNKYNVTDWTLNKLIKYFDCRREHIYERKINK